MKKINLKKLRTLLLLALAIVAVAVCAGIRYYRTVERRNAVEGRLTVHIIDVGQGDASLLTFPDGRTAMIDTGTAQSAGDVIAYLERWEIERIDYIFLSHDHSDHAGGLEALCEAFEVGELCYTGEVPTVEGEGKLPALRELTTGSAAEIGGVKLTVLAPLTDGEDGNNNSMVLRLDYGERSFLFMGDAEEEEESDLLEHCPELLDADLMKVGHHGSANSSSDAFVQAVSPKVAVISASEDNTFGHPTPSVVAKLRAAGALVYSTHEYGSVTLICDGKEIVRRSGDDYLALPEHPFREARAKLKIM